MAIKTENILDEYGIPKKFNDIWDLATGKEAKENHEEKNLRKLQRQTEEDFETLKNIADVYTALNDIIKPQKKATESWMNKYAFISYGGNTISGQGNQMKDSFWGSDEQMASIGANTDIEKWKSPTTKNIIEWSKEISNKALKDYGNGKQANIEDKETPAVDDKRGLKKDANPAEIGNENETGYTPVSIADNFRAAKLSADNSKKTVSSINSAYGSGNTIQGLGNLEYEWKDFSFIKWWGKIPNNRLITLRRFKLPVLDNGVIAGKERLKKLIESSGTSGESSEQYLTSDSARGLTYFGEGTGNNLNDFVGFSVGLNWDTNVQPTGGTENPEINKNVSSGGANFLNDPIDGSMIVNKILGDPNTNTLSRIAHAHSLQKQSNDEDGNIQDYILRNSKDFDPFKTGWQYRIYGPINVVTRTSRRKRGLNFTGTSFNIKFSYDISQVGTQNPKIVALDIISNMLALTYGNGSFYGGDYRFHRQPTPFQLPDTLVDNLEKAASGSADVEWQDIYKGLESMTTDYYDSVAPYGEEISKYFGSFLSSLRTAFQNSEVERESLVNEITQQVGSAKSTDDLDKEKLKTTGLDAFSATINPLNEQAQNLTKSDWESLFSTLKEFSTKQGSLTNIVLKAGILKQGYNIQDISNRIMTVNPLITGEPVGEWHVTVGNPMNPIMMIGNLICTSMKMSFGEVLGPDDFPTELNFEISLTHGRDRDMGDIESMFNLGQGRFYTPITNSKEPWDTGFSSRNTENDTGGLTNSQKKRLSVDPLGGIVDAEQELSV